MDGVLVDFVTAALDLHGRSDVLADWPVGERDIPKVLGLSAGEFWSPIHSTGERYWADLAPYDWTFQLVDLVREFAPFTILTSPSLDPGCPAGKVQWMNRHLTSGRRKRFRDFLIGPQKHLLARADTLLIDDTERHIDEFIDAGGQAILFPQPWNRNHAIDDALGFVREELMRLA
jgi:hypothetical protein